MIDIVSAAEATQSDIQAVTDWMNTQYALRFAAYFEDLENLLDRMSSKSRPITDSELEFILIDLPLKLFSAAEEINSIKLNLEVVKLRNKKTLTEKIKTSKESTATMKKDVAESEMFEDKVLEFAYSCLLDRVDREVSYARELIMGAKKVWDSRRKSDVVNPVSESNFGRSNRTPVY